MRLLLIKERLFLFGEFAVSKSQYLYNKQLSSLHFKGQTKYKKVAVTPVTQSDANATTVNLERLS